MEADTRIERVIRISAWVAFAAPVVGVALMFAADATGLPGLWLLPTMFLAVMSPLLIMAGYVVMLGCRWVWERLRGVGSSVDGVAQSRRFPS
ncbi:MAG: hypothetical protein ACLFRV_03985 [Acidimicrobiales bacterium]